MNLDRMTIAVRRRSVPELYDLALLVAVRHRWPLLALTAIGAGPWIVLDAWLLHGDHGLVAGRWYLLLLLAAVQAPLATAPITAFLGEAMFASRPSLRSALRTAGRRWAGLLLTGLVYGLLALVPLLLLLAPPQAVPVLVLEQVRGRAAWIRANALRAAGSGTWAVHLLIAAVLVPLALWAVIGTGNAVGNLLGTATVALDPGEWLPQADPGASVVPALVLFLVLAYLAVVHFLAYLDLRTVREGWDVDLALRRAAERCGASA